MLARARRSLMLALLLALLLALALAPRPAAAQACADPCVDADRDGFAACPCATSSVCDCDDADPTTFPGAPERCDATKDRDCSGTAGSTCGPDRGCYEGVCVPECVPLDDFGCPFGSDFGPKVDGRCVCAPKDCSVFGCPAGSTCDDALTCVATCPAEVRCPRGQRCDGFGCVDPCSGVACGAGSLCKEGRCVPACDCAPGDEGCPSGETCVRAETPARCVARACAGVSCPAGTRCEGGACIPGCEGVVCPPKQVCLAKVENGRDETACVSLCIPDPCALGEACDWRTGTCTPRPRPGGLRPGGDPADGALYAGGNGLTCAEGTNAGPGAFAVVAGAIVVALRRRRARV